MGRWRGLWRTGVDRGVRVVVERVVEKQRLCGTTYRVCTIAKTHARHGALIVDSFFFFFLFSFFPSCLHSARLSRDALALPGGGGSVQQASKRWFVHCIVRCRLRCDHKYCGWHTPAPTRHTQHKSEWYPMHAHLLIRLDPTFWLNCAVHIRLVSPVPTARLYLCSKVWLMLVQVIGEKVVVENQWSWRGLRDRINGERQCVGFQNWGQG